MNHRIGFQRRVKHIQRCDARLRMFIHDCVHAKMGSQISLRTKRVADTGNCARIGGLDAGHHALDVMTIIRFAAAVTVAPAAGSFYYAEIGWVRTSAHGAVGKVCVQRKSFAAVTTDTAKGFDRMRSTDLWQVRVAGDAIFGFAGKGWGEGDGGGLAGGVPPYK